jgi:hypothetical protein
MLKALRSFLRSVPARLTGSRVSVGSEHVTRLSSAAKFPPDELLERRIKAAREVMGTVEVKALRLIETHPDADTVHAAEDFHGPIG